MSENKETIETKVEETAEVDTTLTDEQIDEIAETAAEADNGALDEAKAKVEVDTEAELDSDTVGVNDKNEIDLVAEKLDRDVKIGLFDLENADKVDEATKQKINDNVKSSFNLTDDETYAFLSLIDDFKKNKNTPMLYERLPASLRAQIDQLMGSVQINPANSNKNAVRENVTKYVMDQFINDAQVDAAFIDLEKSLNEALSLPTIVDMYGEHTKELMETKIPEMAEKIKEEEPEKAELLLKVKEAYTKSYNFSEIKEKYEESSSIRSSVRKADIWCRKYLEELNAKNTKTRFKMYSALDCVPALNKVLIDHPAVALETAKIYNSEVDEGIQKILDMEITELDIQKFCSALACSCEGYDAEKIVDATYMYYLIKNIVMLRHTEVKKTEFTGELINNICEVITLIRNKEAEFYEQNPHLLKSKRAKKRNSAGTGKR